MAALSPRFIRKQSYFASRPVDGWPRPEEIEHYFLAPAGQRWFFETRNDSGGFSAQEMNSLDQSIRVPGGFHLSFGMWGHPELGVLLTYSRWEDGTKQSYVSKGDVTRLTSWVRSFHGTALPVGLFIPYQEAWGATKEFLESDGALPSSIEWIASADLPAGTFPDS